VNCELGTMGSKEETGIAIGPGEPRGSKIEQNYLKENSGRAEYTREGDDGG